MLVLQQIKVLPAGAHFIITDEGRTKTEGFISENDKSLIFLSAYEADTYYKVYSNFRVTQLTAKLGVIENGIQYIDYVIEIRGE